MTGLVVADAEYDVDDVATLEEIARRVLWLATRIVDAANHDRPNAGGIKVGGHQASSASMVSLMTALWFAHLGHEDRVSVKPHASPVLHAINYLLGHLEEADLRTLRSFGGLQAYPSRTKDADPVDFSTGSVGLGATAPLFAAATRRYVDAHFGSRPSSRFIALLGDAELDEGNIWEALLDPVTAGLGNVLWIVDLNRQSLDRVVPGIKVRALERAFADVGWQVLEAKYGRRLQKAFEAPGGDRLRDRIDAMPNDEYQAVFGLAPDAVRDAICLGDDVLRGALDIYDDHELRTLVADLGGHDVAVLLDLLRQADADVQRPTVLFAYTMKGWGLPFAGDPLNHSALLTTAQVDALRVAVGLDAGNEWARFDEASAEGRLCASTAASLRRRPATPGVAVDVPVAALGPPVGTRHVSTQEAFGRVLSNLARTDVGGRIVTVAPDVSVSTSLGGWINKVGVFAPERVPDRSPGTSALKWEQSPDGRHLELGISEMNLFSMLGQLGLAWDLSAQPLLPVGTVYDPFVCRGLDAFIYALYNGARFVVAGTPSGVTLAPEGGAHQSTVTASIGLELPGVTLAEPAYARALDWLLCDGLARIADLERPSESLYVRLSTRPLDQRPFEAAVERAGEEPLRAAVLAGGYRLLDPPVGGRPRVVLVGCGAVLPEVLGAAEALDGEGVDAVVVDVTSLDRLYGEWAAGRRRRIGDVAAEATTPTVWRLLEPGVPVVSVHDAASHAMAWLGSVHGTPVIPLGVDRFGQSGTIDDLYRHFHLDTDAIINAALLSVGC